ncbi:MAG: hypothetical protein KAG53_07725 [Endozoicomonadaceae bacterium]|nr:hypothetical protein [Endozoicomonadaceae bacterium]
MNMMKTSSSREQSPDNITNEHNNIQNASSNNIQGASSNNIPCSHVLLADNGSRSLADRSVIKSKNVTPEEFILLIKNGTWLKNIHYVVNNALTLKDIHNLHNLPDYVTVKGGLYINGCNDLIYLCKTLVVEYSLEIENCNNLKYIADHLTINASLYIIKNNILEFLAKTLLNVSEISINDCLNFSTLPCNLISDRLIISRCCLTRIPENLIMNGDLFIELCHDLKHTPDYLTVCGNLEISECISLTNLPDHLTVKGNLFINDCNMLTCVNGTLVVEGNLSIRACNNLTHLDDGIFVGGDIDLSSCSSLRYIPGWIVRLRKTSSGNTRTAMLQETGISREIIEEFRTANAHISPSDIEFQFSPMQVYNGYKFYNFDEAINFWKDKALLHGEVEIPDMSVFLATHQSKDLCRFLEQLTSTADYNNGATRPILAQRIMRTVLSFISMDKDTIEQAMFIINIGISSCSDRASLVLDELEMEPMLKLAEAQAYEKNDSDKLKEFGQKMMILDKIKLIANKRIAQIRATNTYVDEIEVYRFLHIKLCPEFGLPNLTKDMLFPGCAACDDQVVEEAIKEIKEYCNDSSQLENYLHNWNPWQKYQRYQNTPSFEELQVVDVDKIEVCCILNNNPDQMVILDNKHIGYDALRKTVSINGNNPFTNATLKWSDVRRLKNK